MSQPERQIGRYVIVREIGRGGMAAVYLARQLDLDRDVALKELNTFHAADPAFAERFVRESRMAGSINHPNVVTVYDFLTEGGVPYIAMEYLEAGSLRSYIGRTSLAQTIGVLEGALAGLAQAERREIIHRDIKPENLMVTSDGEVKIADFGIAKALTEAGGPNLTATGTTVGTPAYMAPEQATAGPVGPWTDLYSIGVTAYEMTVGRVPFHDSETPVAVLLRQVNEVIPPAISVDPRIDRRLSDWIERLLVKDPTARTQSARQAWYELEEIAVSMLGPLWRREARLVVSGADRAAGPLTPAPFERQTPAPEPQDEYRTFAGDAPAPPPPPVELPPPTPPPAQTIPPAPAVPPPAAPTDPARTAAPASVPAAANETFEWPAAGGGRRKIGLAVVAVALLAAAGFIAYKGLSGGSSKKATPPPKHHKPKPPPAKPLPTLTADSSRFVPGTLISVAGFNNQTAYAVLVSPTSAKVINLQDTSAPGIPVIHQTVGLADGDGALWASEITSPTSGQIIRIVPGGSPAAGPPITFHYRPADLRAVVSNGTIWEPIKDGLLKIPEHGGTAVRVKGLSFTPISLELEAGAIWAVGKDTLAKVLVDAGVAAPTAHAVPYPGAQWVTGDSSSVYLETKTGVDKVDPATLKGTPVAGITAPPIRIGLVDGILWTATYTVSGSTATGTIEGFDVANPSRHTAPVTVTAPGGNYAIKLVDVANTFWLTVTGPGGKSGLEPYTISS